MEPLTPEELRVVACLVEKQFTTPDSYPLTENAVVAARDEALVARLERQPGQKEARYAQLLAGPVDAGASGGSAVSGHDTTYDEAGPSPADRASTVSSGPVRPDRVTALEDRVAALEAELAVLQAEHRELREELGLGTAPPPPADADADADEDG